MELTQEVLKHVIDQDGRAVTIESIQKFVSDYYQLKMGELKSRNNSKSIAMPRQIAMYLCKNLTHASLPEIGRSFGGKHHSTVIHSIKKVELMRKATEFSTASSRISLSHSTESEAVHRPGSATHVHDLKVEKPHSFRACRLPLNGSNIHTVNY